jgi:large subunit ribosomal protein L28
MSRICDLTGKRPITGHSVSHSNVKTKRRFLPNLHKKRFYIQETDQWVTLKVSSYALRTINKKGVYAFLTEQQQKGFELPIELKEPNPMWWAAE